MGLKFRAVLLGAVVLSAAMAAAQTKTPRYEVGAQFVEFVDLGSTDVYMYGSKTTCIACDITRYGVGARFVYNPARFLSLEGEWNFSPQGTRRAETNLFGGRVSEGLFGVKTGLRRRRFGVYARYAPGFLSSGQAITSVKGNAPLTFNYNRITSFRQYAGGVLELNLSRRIALRYDLGMAWTYHRVHAAPDFTDCESGSRAEVGVMWRF